jgi:D-glycero-D-manno-heptose 1,7-bisphosphate phosphatase
MPTRQSKAVFLDRDGVINRDSGYPHRIEDIEFLDGVFPALKIIQRLGFLLIVITNQSGIARGLFSVQDFQTLMDWMKSEFAVNGIDITGIYYCPHLEGAPLKSYDVRCDCRKPQPGLLLSASADYSIDLAQSIMIGDRATDMEAAHRAGVPKRYLISPNSAIEPANRATRAFPNLMDCALHIHSQTIAPLGGGLNCF